MPIRRLRLSGTQAEAASRDLSTSGGNEMNATEDPMSDAPEERDDFSDWDQAEGEGPFGETLVVDVEGFEGPLDVLLALARTPKVDRARISVLGLAHHTLD